MEQSQKMPWLVMIENYAKRLKEIKKSSEIDPLSIDERIELKIELSWGGPSDGFKLYLDKRTRQAVEGFYYYADWFTYEEQSLDEQELNLVAEYFGIY